MTNELSCKEARLIIDEIAASIRDKTGKEVLTDINTRKYGKRGFCINTPTVKKIGVDTTWIESVPSVSPVWFTDTVLTLYHEAQHMARYDELGTGDGDHLIMALTIVDNINRSYYITNYPNDIRELDAEMHAITNTVDSLHLFFGDQAHDMVKASVLSRHRNPNRQNISKDITITTKSSIAGITDRYRQKIEDIKTGKIIATKYSLAASDPVFQFIDNSQCMRKTFMRIPDTDFVTMTEFLATVSLYLNEEILDEFPNNEYLHSLKIEHFIEKLKNEPVARRIRFTAAIPNWYKKAIDSSQRCIDNVQNNS